jgi:hypothetical protein
VTGLFHRNDLARLLAASGAGRTCRGSSSSGGSLRSSSRAASGSCGRAILAPRNLGWAIGYNSLALPIAAGVFEPWGFTLRPELAAISMSGSSVLVAVNALLLKRLRL